MERHSFQAKISGFMSDKYADALFEAGCDDALLSEVDGVLMLDFDRAAESYEDALSSAAHDVERAGGTIMGVKRLESQRST